MGESYDGWRVVQGGPSGNPLLGLRPEPSCGVSAIRRVSGAGARAMTALYIYAAAMSKYNPTTLTRTLVQGYRIADSEDAARGSALAAAMEFKPGFSVDDLLVMLIPTEAMQLVASGMEAFGRDGETRLDAKHDSPTAESGDAQTQSHHPKGNN